MSEELTTPIERLFPPGMTLEQAIHTALGAASVCWEKMEGTGEFQSTRAREIGMQLMEFLEERGGLLDPARSKGEKIVADCLYAGEPFFVFRARDIFTIMVLRKYAQLTDEFGPMDLNFSESVHTTIDRMRVWQKENPRQVRYPD